VRFESYFNVAASKGVELTSPGGHGGSQSSREDRTPNPR